MLRRKKRIPRSGVLAVQTGGEELPFEAVRKYVPLNSGELRLYRQLRESVPMIDAALDKLVRLVGKFHVECSERRTQDQLNMFLHTIPVGAGNAGIHAFLTTYLSQLLTYGNAVGEAVVQNGELKALYNASLEDVELRVQSPLEIEVCRRCIGGSKPVQYPELVFHTALNPKPGSAKGTSILQGLSFVSDILIKIYHAIGVNWERAGNVRFAVTCRPGAEDSAFAAEHAQQMAEEWSKAMRPGSKSDFVAVGDVHIQAIGADNQILDSEVPVRQMLEQIVAKLGVPPFLLGLSWSSTERMSSQQADILTSELEAYRRLLNPVIDRICSLWMRLLGCSMPFDIVWNDVTLQDQTELAKAALNNAQAELIQVQTEKLRKEI
ncbi:MAG TPA: serine/threonine protein phosphatase [Ruminococcaceae bacterium]|nr:serine/threonine protein phosphatase [Oscillospiraceae bacterium]